MKRISIFLWVALGLSLVMPAFGDEKSIVHTPESNDVTILVKNAILVDSNGEGGDQQINLFIKNGILKMVSADTVPEESFDFVIDARQGYILGELDVGNLANFIILDKNPIEHFETLLDTKTHATLVIREGIIVLDRLNPLSKNPKKEVKNSPKKESSKNLQKTTPEIEYKKPNWFAYSAPPIALPAFYRNSHKWNQFKSRYVNGVFIAGVLLDRMTWLHQNDASENQVGDLSSFDGGEIRALRFGLVGTLNFDQPWIYTIFLATHAFDQGFDSDDNDQLTLFDFRLDIPFYKDTSLSIGKQKEPISMERLMALVDLPMQERGAVSDAMMPSRNIGLVLSGTGFDRRCSWAGGVFNPWLDQGNSISESPTQIIGRGTFLPLVSADESTLLHLGAGVRYSTARQDVHYRSTPEFNSSPEFVDSGPIPADSTVLYDLEAALRWGPLLVNGEYVINQIDAADVSRFNGFHITASYVLTGEMRPYNKRNGLFRPVPVSKPVTCGGWGAWEVATRFSNVDLTDGAIDGGDMNIYSLGLNWELTTGTSLSINYRHIVLDKDEESGHSDGLMMRVTLMLE